MKCVAAHADMVSDHPLDDLRSPVFLFPYDHRLQHLIGNKRSQIYTSAEGHENETSNDIVNVRRNIKRNQKVSWYEHGKV